MRIRPERVGQLMKREIAEILERRLRDPRLGSMVSITDVEVTQDLSLARVMALLGRHAVQMIPKCVEAFLPAQERVAHPAV